MLKRVHHINFLVKDLEKSVGRYQDLFELNSLEIEELPERGVVTARFDVAGVWIVLVQPLDERSEPARHVELHGEGLFLVSFAVDDLAEAQQKLVLRGAISDQAKVRNGLQNWRVIDLNPEAVFGAAIQLTEER